MKTFRHAGIKVEIKEIKGTEGTYYIAKVDNHILGLTYDNEEEAIEEGKNIAEGVAGL